MSHLVSFIVGLLVFLAWVRIVGNPHVVETVLGLAIACSVGLWVYFRFRRVSGKRKSSRSGTSD